MFRCGSFAEQAEIGVVPRMAQRDARAQTDTYEELTGHRPTTSQASDRSAS